MISWIPLALVACGDDSSDDHQFNQASDVYAALVKRLEDDGRVLHVTVTSTQSDNPNPLNSVFWVDEANDLAREDQAVSNIPGREVLVVNGKKYIYFGSNKPVQSAAPSCEGVAAPAISLLLACEGVAGSRSSLEEAGGQKISIVTAGSYGADIGNKPWTRTLTVDADSLMPLSLESDLWAVLNNEPYQVHESWTYTTELVDRRGLPADLFALK